MADFGLLASSGLVFCDFEGLGDKDPLGIRLQSANAKAGKSNKNRRRERRQELLILIMHGGKPLFELKPIPNIFEMINARSSSNSGQTRCK